jgi:hypothetical protein
MNDTLFLLIDTVGKNLWNIFIFYEYYYHRPGILISELKYTLLGLHSSVLNVRKIILNLN